MSRNLTLYAGAVMAMDFILLIQFQPYLNHRYGGYWPRDISPAKPMTQMMETPCERLGLDLSVTCYFEHKKTAENSGFCLITGLFPFQTTI